eukprot:gnl/MRDRNA2_/MRDRNA2_132358_c0_seq1.p1 gnl/MRDRNA2_/MRDRNA2_132358_c0~~gnl/MRDRNA2_/MRDRNA2_132358_c0_seq1.p1  ORF type:complete len:347 (-),score=38.87 gnl/MRDRNA2_/MRDRNA2_132358_c0_seq1:115-1005(-)
MSGDVIGAWALVVVPKIQRFFGYTGKATCFVLRFFAPPYHISVLLLSWIGLHLAIASPTFVIAVAAQVLMGTVFVFQFQYVIEMIQTYANGDDRIFKNMLFVSSVAFDTAYGCGSTMALYTYDNIGKLVPFYIAAGVAAVAFVLYTGYFIMRVGLPQSFREFEKQRANARSNGEMKSMVMNVEPSECTDECRGGALPPGGEKEKQDTTQSHVEQCADNTADQPMNARMSLFSRVDALLFDCGITIQSSDGNIVSRAQQLASDLGLQFESVLALVQKAELLVYGSIKSNILRSSSRA